MAIAVVAPPTPLPNAALAHSMPARSHVPLACAASPHAAGTAHAHYAASYAPSEARAMIAAKMGYGSHSPAMSPKAALGLANPTQTLLRTRSSGNLLSRFAAPMAIPGAARGFIPPDMATPRCARTPTEEAAILSISGCSVFGSPLPSSPLAMSPATPTPSMPTIRETPLSAAEARARAAEAKVADLQLRLAHTRRALAAAEARDAVLAARVHALEVEKLRDAATLEQYRKDPAAAGVRRDLAMARAALQVMQADAQTRLDRAYARHDAAVQRLHDADAHWSQVMRREMEEHDMAARRAEAHAHALMQELEAERERRTQFEQRAAAALAAGTTPASSQRSGFGAWIPRWMIPSWARGPSRPPRRRTEVDQQPLPFMERPCKPVTRCSLERQRMCTM